MAGRAPASRLGPPPGRWATVRGGDGRAGWWGTESSPTSTSSSPPASSPGRWGRAPASAAGPPARSRGRCTRCCQELGPELGQATDAVRARAIADLFDRYTLYRPQMVRIWSDGRDVDAGGGPLDAHQLGSRACGGPCRQRLGGPTDEQLLRQATESGRSRRRCRPTSPRGSSCSAWRRCRRPHLDAARRAGVATGRSTSSPRSPRPGGGPRSPPGAGPHGPSRPPGPALRRDGARRPRQPARHRVGSGVAGGQPPAASTPSSTRAVRSPSPAEVPELSPDRPTLLERIQHSVRADEAPAGGGRGR